MQWFSEHSVNHLRNYRSRLSCKILSGSVIVVSVQPEIPHLLRDNLTFPLALLLVFLDPLVFINAVHKSTHTLTGSLVKDFLKSCFVGRPTLKVLTATSSKSPSISLNISSICPSTFSRSPIFAWTWIIGNPRVDEPYYMK